MMPEINTHMKKEHNVYYPFWKIYKQLPTNEMFIDFVFI